MTAAELALGEAVSTGVFHGFVAVKRPPAGAPPDPEDDAALDEELVVAPVVVVVLVVVEAPVPELLPDAVVPAALLDATAVVPPDVDVAPLALVVVPWPP